MLLLSTYKPFPMCQYVVFWTFQNQDHKILYTERKNLNFFVAFMSYSFAPSTVVLSRCRSQSYPDVMPYMVPGIRMRQQKGFKYH